MPYSSLLSVQAKGNARSEETINSHDTLASFRSPLLYSNRVGGSKAAQQIAQLLSNTALAAFIDSELFV